MMSGVPYAQCTAALILSYTMGVVTIEEMHGSTVAATPAEGERGGRDLVSEAGAWLERSMWRCCDVQSVSACSVKFCQDAVHG